MLVLVALAACAARAQATTNGGLTVYAAASLTDVFPKIDPAAKYSFGGSNMVEAQIVQGAPADVFASANMTLPTALYRKSLCSKPVAFTRNALVIVVPRSNPARIHGIDDLTKRGVKVDIAAAGVPVGSYTLQVLKKLKLSAAVLKNIVSRETDVREVLSKVALDEADAGFVYSTDAKTVRGRVTVITLPARAQPTVQYGICVVRSSSHKAAARRFVSIVLAKAGQAKLRFFGFLPRAK